jgi:3'(2'), 5'-bisphosphate nucleotidase
MTKPEGFGCEERLLDELSSVVSAAAAAILAARRHPLEAHIKPDQSPVCAADHAAEAVILDAISRLLPGVPVVSEEATARSPVPNAPSGTFVLVDPLDGTRELLAGRDEFTVNLAVMDGAAPWLGIVAAPAAGVLWRGIVGRGAERLILPAGAFASAATSRAHIHTRKCPHSGLIAAVSRSHLDSRTLAFLTRLPLAQRLPSGSAVKFCQIAQGNADVYPRLSTTCEWDVAAGHAVLAAAGGVVTTPEGGALRYGRGDKEFRVAGFIAWGDPAAPEALGLANFGSAPPRP